MGELLVEISAQALEFLGFAQVFGRNDLVEPRDERLVVGAARFVFGPLARSPRLGRAFRIAHFGIARPIGGWRGGCPRGARAVVARVGPPLLPPPALSFFCRRRFCLPPPFLPR